MTTTPPDRPSVDTDDATDDAARPARWTTPRIALVVVVATLLAAGVALALVGVLGGDDGGSPGGETLVFDVPPGTGDRLDAGEDVALLPERLELDVGDTIEIQNRDDRVHSVGPYTIAPRQTLRQTFDSPGVVEGVCSLHPSGQVEIVIT